MLIEQMRVGVKKNERNIASKRKRKRITHGVRSHGCH